MESTEELQKLEMTALKAIYAQDFVECPPPVAWQGANHLKEFIITLPHPVPVYAHKVIVLLHVKLPKTYPTIACPIFMIQKSSKGLNNKQITKLSHEVNVEAQNSRGSESIFHVATFCQDWLSTHVKPPAEMKGSLARQMTERAFQEDLARRQREAEDAEKEKAKAEQAAREFEEMVLEEDAARQLRAREEEEFRSRKRANSETTEVPLSGETLTETFSQEVDVGGVRFQTVKVFHPRTELLGVVYMADPVCDNVNTTLPLELFSVTFSTAYYSSQQGKRKLEQLETEIKQLTAIRHLNVQSVFAVKLKMSYFGGPSQLLILTEQSPPLTLQDVLEDSESLREERCSSYICQILQGLDVVHTANLVHRGINAGSVGLASSDASSQHKLVKLGRVGYYTKLLDLHRSNSFGPHTHATVDEPSIPDSWLSRDVKNESSLFYTHQRDLHAVGIILLQMLLGLDVMERFEDIHDALESPAVPPTLRQLASSMLLPSRKSNFTCSSLLRDLAEPSLQGMESDTGSSPAELKTPMAVRHGVPETDYFRATTRTRQSSRWKEDWEELELLGKGAFGSVVKARNKIDNRIYAVKKVRLRTMQTDNKIYREVNALSRLSHRFVVRYYTTWMEESDPLSAFTSDDSSAESGTEDGRTSVPGLGTRHIPLNGGYVVDPNDLDENSASRSSSFPSIIFESSSSPPTSEDSSGDESDSLFHSGHSSGFAHTPPVSRTLYIQMEFVERQTLKERMDEGISEMEGWRLFQQMVDALVHMATLGILHRDIKPTNIFIDANNDCKVGDFGLATSSLAAVDPSDVAPYAFTANPEMTLEVGTRLYIAPEVQSKSRRRGPRNHSKADMYSLGIVFFEMNYKLNTGAERAVVIENLRRPQIRFPQSWDARRANQRSIIEWLLQHEPDERPTALELSRSPLMPSRVEDEHFKEALEVMTKPDTPHHQALLSRLFSQASRPTRNALYDVEANPRDHASLNDIVQKRLGTIFRLHGAVDMEPPLLMPLTEVEEQQNQAAFIDRHGDVVTLPSDALVPFARLAVRENNNRIKRYHISNIFRPSSVAGHPKAYKAAVFDIITNDLEWGPIAAGAEIIAVANDCLNSFPNLAQAYEIHISHSTIVEHALNRVRRELRTAVVDILSQHKSSSSQKRALLLKKGLPRSTADELEILTEIDENFSNIIAKLERSSPSLLALIKPACEELKNIVRYAASASVSKTIYFRPLMTGSQHAHFRDGVLVEIVRINKRTDLFAAGGRYDNLFSHFHTLIPGKSKPDPVCAIGLHIHVEKITQALAAFQSASVKALVKEERSFGFWSPRRCDVYVVSYHPGYLQERLDVAAYLWQHNIRADLMYETGLVDAAHESYVDLCTREGILFTVCPRPRTGRRDQAAFKVKSVLKGTEYELSRQELIPWLQHEIAEQKRVDLGTSGATTYEDHLHYSNMGRDTMTTMDIQMLLPTDAKKPKKVKQIFQDKAFETCEQIKTSVLEGMATLAVDIPPALFDMMVRSSLWVTDDDSWKAIVTASAAQTSTYLTQIRDAVAKRKIDEHVFILLFAVRDGRAQLLHLN